MSASKGFEFIQADVNNEGSFDESRIPYVPPVNPLLFGKYAAYLLLGGFIFMSLFTM